MKHSLLVSLAKGVALSLTVLGSAQVVLAQPGPDAAPVPEESPTPTEPLPADVEADTDTETETETEAATDSEPAATRVLVVPIDSKSDAMLETATKITEALAAAATESGASVDTSEASRAQITDLSDCRDEAPACMQTMLDAVSADVMILGSMVATEGGWILTVKQVRRGKEDKISTHVLQGDQPELLDAKVRELSKATFGIASDAVAPVGPAPIVEKPPVVTDGTSKFSLRKVNTAAWAVTGAGVGLAVVGATLLVVASGKQSDVDNAPDATLDDITRLRDLESSADSYELFGNSFLIAGALTSVVGISWAVWQARSGTEAAPSALLLAPSPTQGGAMVTLSWFP